MNRVTRVKVLDRYKVDLTFANGSRGKVDLSSLVGGGVFAAWNDYDEFQRVTIGPDGSLVWPCGVDLCPDSLFLKMTGKKPDEVFPALKNELAHA